MTSLVCTTGNVKLDTRQTENFTFLHERDPTLILSAFMENSSYQTLAPRARDLGILPAPPPLEDCASLVNALGSMFTISTWKRPHLSSPGSC